MPVDKPPPGDIVGFATDRFRGLSIEEAARRQGRFGPNELPRLKARTFFALALSVLTEPVFLLLLAAGLIYFVLGDLFDALVLIVFVLLSALISVLQQRKSERILEALRDLSSPRALAVRSHQLLRVPGRDVVPGDLVSVVHGDRVVADGILLQATHLQVDESLLTGESLPIAKVMDAPIHARRLYAGTLVTSGRGIMRITSTGQRSELGKIGTSTAQLPTVVSPLQRSIRTLVRMFSVAAVIVSLVTMVAVWMAHHDVLAAALAGITVAMGLLPEEFGVVIVVFLAMGAWRLSQRGVLTRDRNAIETLGAATVLCTDKTGTLTLNEMSVMAVLAAGPVDAKVDKSQFHLRARHGRGAVLWAASLTCAEKPHDPMEQAILRSYQEIRTDPCVHHDAHQVIREYPFSENFFAVMRVLRFAETPCDLVAMKGAPEVVMEYCNLSQEQREQVAHDVAEMAEKGLRVIAVATSEYFFDALPDRREGFVMTYRGLIGLADPLREGVEHSVHSCIQAGVRVVMITGDYPATAYAIARQAGIVTDDQRPEAVVITGDDLRLWSDAELNQHIHSARVFARVQPIEKLRLVRAFQAAGHVVAMTGDGVNDAPALKAADIGIAMGRRGTDVAREAAALVLLEDDFRAIVDAMARGRLIYSNLRKAVGFVVAIHVPIAGLATLPIMLGLPMLLLPVHIAFMEMIIDPISSIVFESQEARHNAMREPPRNPAEPLFPWLFMVQSILQGALGFSVLAFGLWGFSALGYTPEQIRTLMFVGLVFSGLGIVVLKLGPERLLDVFSQHQYRVFLYIALAISLLLTVVTFLPPLRGLFQFQAVQVWAFALAVATPLMVLAVLGRRIGRHPQLF